MLGMNGGQHSGQPNMGGPMNMLGLGGQSMGMSMGGGMNPQMGPPGTITPHMQVRSSNAGISSCPRYFPLVLEPANASTRGSLQAPAI